MASIISSLGHERFSRLKIGIGRRDGVLPEDYVLAKMGSRTQDLFQKVAEIGAQSLRFWLEEGVDSSMNRFNAGPGAGRCKEEND